MMRYLVGALAFTVLLAVAPAFGQSSPGFNFGQIPTSDQWNQAFSNKADYLGSPYCPTGGCGMTGELVTAASTTSSAGLNLPPGSAPTSPNNGDFWSTSSGFFAQVAGVTIQLTGSGSGSFTATPPVAVTFPGGGVVNYALDFNSSLASSGGNLGINLANPNTWTATLTVDPPSGTTTPALVANNTGPSSGSTTTPFSYNTLTASNPGYATSGNTLDAYGLLPQISTFRSNMSGQGSTSGGLTAIIGVSKETGASPNVVGIAGSAYSNISSSNDQLYATIGYSNVGASGSVAMTIGLDGESANQGTIKYRLGVNAFSLAGNQASGSGSVDSAFSVQTGQNPYTSSQATSWHYAFALVSGVSTYPPLDLTGSVFYSDQTFSTGSFANLANVTFGTAIFNFKGFQVSGNSGTVTAAIGANSAPSAPDIVEITCSTCGIIQEDASANSTSGFDGLQIFDSSGNNLLVPIVFEASFNAVTHFGQTLGNWAALLANGSTNAGLMVGTVNDVPVIFGVNNVEVGRWSSATVGQLDVGFAGTTVGILALHNATSGFIHLVTPSGALGSAVATLPDNTGTIGETNLAQIWSAVQTHNTGDLVINGGAATAGLATVTSGGVVSSEASATVAQGGTNCATASITCFNNITGYSAAGATGTTSTNLVFSGSPTIATPTLNGGATTITANTGSIPSETGTMLYLANADTNSTLVTMFAAGTGTAGAVRYFASRGTLAVPTALQNGDSYGANFAFAYSASYNPAAGFQFTATENMSSGHQGTVTQIYASPNGGSLEVEASFQGGVTIGTTNANPGIGSLDVTAQVYIPNIASDATFTDNTACWRSGSTPAGQLLKGSGTLGICLGTSGEQFKRDVEPLGGGNLAKIAAIQLKSYYYLPGFGDDGGKEQYGVIAQQVATIDPLLVGRDEKGEIISVDWPRFIFLSIGAIQELKADNDNLRAEVERLRSAHR